MSETAYKVYHTYKYVSRNDPDSKHEVGTAVSTVVVYNSIEGSFMRCRYGGTGCCLLYDVYDAYDRRIVCELHSIISDVFYEDTPACHTGARNST